MRYYKVLKSWNYENNGYPKKVLFTYTKGDYISDDTFKGRNFDYSNHPSWFEEVTLEEYLNNKQEEIY